MRPDCKLERNLRIYRAHKKGVPCTRLAQLAGISPQRVQQIIAFTEMHINRGDINYTAVFSDN